MDAMQKELLSEGHDVAFLAVNVTSGVSSQAALTGACEYPVFQDTAEVGAWAQAGGGKDDLYVYDATGHLVHYLPFGGEVDTNLSTPTGYGNLKAAVLDAMAP
jgi:hypothetical protein